MGYMKKWFEDHVHEFSDRELMDMGYSRQDISEFRECFPGSKKEDEEDS